MTYDTRYIGAYEIVFPIRGEDINYLSVTWKKHKTICNFSRYSAAIGPMG